MNENQDDAGVRFRIQEPTDCIAELVLKMAVQDATDPELLKILETHILKEDPSSDAVEEAASAIRKLATDCAAQIH
ncbi:MAG: hypothetical protein GTN81_04920 [Proteobacteria bacterium]|nr:hypothetical protein [Pseudomonadota bacterium]NIT01547.1 hypothetical protein [Candidatus Latescibacterota bacterium]